MGAAQFSDIVDAKFKVISNKVKHCEYNSLDEVGDDFVALEKDIRQLADDMADDEESLLVVNHIYDELDVARVDLEAAREWAMENVYWYLEAEKHDNANTAQ